VALKRSVNRWAGALCSRASLMSRTIFWSELSAAGRSEHGVAEGFFDGGALAGEVGLVGGGPALGNFGVHGELAAGLDE